MRVDGKLSKRGMSLSDEPERVGFARHYRALDDLYDKAANPTGVINMGASETHLIDGQLIQAISDVFRRRTLTDRDLHYVPDHGSELFRSAIASHWQDVIFSKGSARRLASCNIVATTGATVALDMIATVLGDPGDVFLVAAPMYASFEFDIGRRAGVVARPVHAGRDLDTRAFEVALRAARSEGRNVVAVLLASPNNPVGTVYKKSALRSLIDFCVTNDLSIVSDEIYGQTVFDDDTKWTSVHQLVPDAFRARAYSVAGFAKDFGLSGFKVGFTISFNEAASRALQNIAYFSPVSTLTQFALGEFLKSNERFEILRANRATLRRAYLHVVSALNHVGVDCAPASGGAFVMADFRRYMDEDTIAEELKLLDRLYVEEKVNLAPGVAYHFGRPGWLRVCYAQPNETIDELSRRISHLGIRRQTLEHDTAAASA